MLVVNIELLGILIFNEKLVLISDVSLQVGDCYFSSCYGFFEKMYVLQGMVIYCQCFMEFLFIVNINGSGVLVIVFEELFGELLLVLIFSLLMIGIVWLVIVGRMSFLWEISFGILVWEFVFWCQLLQDVCSGCCCGVEILLCWNNFCCGMILLEVFIFIVEGNNLIIFFICYVIVEIVCCLDVFFCDCYFYIVINVVVCYFVNGFLLCDLYNYWFSVDLVQQLVVELIECDVLQDGDQYMVEYLYFKGVQLVIDDFGIGNILFLWLEKLCLDVLKIDCLFISLVGIDSVNVMVIDIIIVFVNCLYIVIVVEGVEMLEQENYLCSYGVDVLQGFYYVWLMLVEVFLVWLVSREESESESEMIE